MKTLITHATVITGDGSPPLEEATLCCENGMITAVEQGPNCISVEGEQVQTIDATGSYVLPGLINPHAHCCSLGPRFSSAAVPPDLPEVIENLDRHLLQGTTTLINLSGFGTIDETAQMNRQHPIRILTGTCHFPACVRAAQMVDGAGLKEQHLALNAEQMLQAGATVIGEIGSGATLGGGVTDYKYIPEAIEKMTGQKITARQAHTLKTAVLTDHDTEPQKATPAQIALMEEMSLLQHTTADDIRTRIIHLALAPIQTALQGFEEACVLGHATGIPVMCHNAAPSIQKIMEQAEKYQGSSLTLVAGHCNHPSFELDRIVEQTRQLRERGVIIDVSSLDAIVTQWMNGPERIEHLVAAGLVDTFSTDYGGGHWDSVLEMIHYLTHHRHLLSLSEAVAKATGHVARIYGEATKNLGLIAPGKTADLLLVDQKNVSRIQKVFIAGNPVADKGGRLARDDRNQKRDLQQNLKVQLITNAKITV